MSKLLKKDISKLEEIWAYETHISKIQKSNSDDEDILPYQITSSRLASELMEDLAERWQKER